MNVKAGGIRCIIEILCTENKAGVRTEPPAAGGQRAPPRRCGDFTAFQKIRIF